LDAISNPSAFGISLCQGRIIGIFFISDMSDEGCGEEDEEIEESIFDSYENVIFISL
jgi:hypothetical protein